MPPRSCPYCLQNGWFLEQKENIPNNAKERTKPFALIFTSKLQAWRTTFDEPVIYQRNTPNLRRFCGNSAVVISILGGNFSRKPSYPTLRHTTIIAHLKGDVKHFLALSLLMALTFWANYHNSAISFDNFALIAHRFYRRSYFHCYFLLI